MPSDNAEAKHQVWRQELEERLPRSPNKYYEPTYYHLPILIWNSSNHLRASISTDDDTTPPAADIHVTQPLAHTSQSRLALTGELAKINRNVSSQFINTTPSTKKVSTHNIHPSATQKPAILPHDSEFVGT